MMLQFGSAVAVAAVAAVAAAQLLQHSAPPHPEKGQPLLVHMPICPCPSTAAGDDEAAACSTPINCNMQHAPLP